MSNTRDLDAKARKLCKQAGESVVLVAQWGERHTTDKQLFRLEGFCDLRGVPLRAGDKFYLRALGPQAGCPDGVHLNADWEVPWQVVEEQQQLLRTLLHIVELRRDSGAILPRVI